MDHDRTPDQGPVARASAGSWRVAQQHPGESHPLAERETYDQGVASTRRLPGAGTGSAHRDRGPDPALGGERRLVSERVLAALDVPGSRVLLVGEPGIGKSFMIDGVVRAVPADRTVLFTRATQYDQDRFRGLRDLLQDVPDERMSSLPTGQRTALLRILDQSATGTPVDPWTVQAGVTHLLADLARDGAVVVVDDWQWLDEDTARVLRQALERPVVRRSLAVLAARRADGTQEDFGIRSLFAPTDVVAVPPLRTATLRRLVLDTFGPRLPEADREAVIGQSSGNPLWALELAAARLESDPRNVAMTVTEAMRDRILAMPAALRSLLELVTVLGRASESGLVGAGATDAHTLAIGVRRRMLHVVDDDVTIAHPLLGAAAVELLSDEERRAVHRRAAALPLDSVQQAEQSDRAQPPGPDDQLAEVLTAAARRAGLTGAAETAHRLARRALTRTPQSSSAWTQRVMDAASAAFVSGHLAEVVALLDEIDPTRLPIAQLDVGVELMSEAVQRVHGRTRVLRRTEDLLGRLPPHSARWDVVEALRLAFTGWEEPDVVDQLASTVGRLDAASAPRIVHAALGWQIALQLDRGDGLDDALLERRRQLERTVPGGTVREDTDGFESALAYQSDDLARSRWRLPAVIRRARDLGDVNRLSESLGHATAIAVLTGSLSTARTLLGEAESASEALLDAPAPVHRARGLLALALDDRDALGAVLESPLAPALEARGDVLKLGLAGLDAAYSGEWEAALPPLERAHRSARARGIREPGRRLWVDIELGRALVHTGQVERAGHIASALAAIGRQPDRVHARAQADRLTALIALHGGDAATALTAFDSAVVGLRTGGFVLELLRTETERLRALVALGRIREARSVLAATTTRADQVGDPRIQRDLEAYRSVVSGDDLRSLLTAAELRVATAVGAGRSNREIATEFFLSVRTVEAQLASVYRKTGVRTRTQLALRVQEEIG